ncbi:hypothetical protein EDB85DRAFT_2150879 [Lactarius pseudohatsudake]|nr:hypothetical protein EDB85DRAFT_2150879 [Lactarius pseudohatsudake]
MYAHAEHTKQASTPQPTNSPSTAYPRRSDGRQDRRASFGSFTKIAQADARLTVFGLNKVARPKNAFELLFRTCMAGDVLPASVPAPHLHLRLPLQPPRHLCPLCSSGRQPHEQTDGCWCERSLEPRTRTHLPTFLTLQRRAEVPIVQAQAQVESLPWDTEPDHGAAMSAEDEIFNNRRGHHASVLAPMPRRLEPSSSPRLYISGTTLFFHDQWLRTKTKTVDRPFKSTIENWANNVTIPPSATTTSQTSSSCEHDDPPGEKAIVKPEPHRLYSVPSWLCKKYPTLDLNPLLPPGAENNNRF